MFFERPTGSGELVVMVHVDFPEGSNREDLAEFRELILSAGAEPVGLVTTKRDTPDTRTFLGKGKVEDVARELELSGDRKSVV